MDHSKPACDLLMFPGVTQVHKRLALSGLSHTIKCENLFIFTIQGTHMRYKTLGFKRLFKHSATHQVQCNWRGEKPAIPNDFIPPSVSGNFNTA